MMDGLDLLSKDGTYADAGVDGALHSIPTLWDGPGWKQWLRHVEGVARLFDIWDYVDPSGDKQLEMPVRPQAPALPDFEECGGRRPNEREEDFQIRLLEYRFKMELANRKLAIREESYRLHCVEFSLKLRRFAARKQALRDLDTAIFGRVSDELRSHITGDSASTPRLKLKKLASVTMGADVKASAPGDDVDSQFLRLMKTIQHADRSNLVSWAADVQAKWESCPQLEEIDSYHKAVKAQFLGVVGDADQHFANTWRKKCDAGERPGELPVSFYDILDEFIQGALVSKAMPLITALEAKSGGGWLQSDRKTCDGWLDSKTEAKTGEGWLQEAKTSDGWLDSKTEAKTSDGWMDSKTEAKSSDGWPSPQSGLAALPAPKTKKMCPGCHLIHMVRDDAWWEDCYVFHQYAGRTVPSWFKERADRIKKVKDRFKQCPAEEDLALRWESCS